MKNKLFACRQIPCYYYFLLLISTILEDSKKVEISSEKLLEATKLLIKEIQNSEVSEFVEVFDIKLTYNYSDLNSEFAKFLDLYQNFVYLKNDKIYLKDNVDHKKIEEELNSIETLEGFDIFRYEIRILRKNKAIQHCLGLHYIREVYRDLISNESLIESIYFDLQNNKNSDILKEKIKTLLDLRNQVYKKLYLKGIRMIESLQDERANTNFYYQEDYPIDFNLYQNSKYNQEDLDETVPLEENLLSVYQIAIFGLISLAEPRLSNDLTLLHIDAYNSDSNSQDIIDYYEQEVYKGNFERVYANQFDSDIIFYLTYIKKLDELMAIYGYNQELENVKTKLIYVLDDPDLNLFIDENREKVLKNKLQNMDIDPVFYDGYSHFSLESLFFIQDIFEGSKGTFTDLLKKIAFVATYYELTNDDKVKKELFNYTSETHYLEYYSFIVKNNSVKKLVK